MRRIEADVGVAAGEAERQPYLGLAGDTGRASLRGGLRRQVVGAPERLSASELGRSVPISSSISRRPASLRRLARVDPALRHLPGRFRRVAALRRPGHEPVRVEQEHADAGPVAGRGSGVSTQASAQSRPATAPAWSASRTLGGTSASPCPGRPVDPGGEPVQARRQRPAPRRRRGRAQRGRRDLRQGPVDRGRRRIADRPARRRRHRRARTARAGAPSASPPSSIRPSPRAQRCRERREPPVGSEGAGGVERDIAAAAASTRSSDRRSWPARRPEGEGPASSRGSARAAAAGRAAPRGPRLGPAPARRGAGIGREGQATSPAGPGRAVSRSARPRPVTTTATQAAASASGRA